MGALASAALPIQFLDLQSCVSAHLGSSSEILNSISEWKDPGNFSRNLKRLIRRWNLSLAVDIAHVEVPVKVSDHVTKVPWPTILLSAWLDFILKRTKGQVLLNGFRLVEDEPQWTRELRAFWLLYRTVDPMHPIYSKDDSWLGYTVPFQYHGDEGRGKLHRAVLILSAQPLLQRKLGHSFLTRLLVSVVPGEKYCVTHDGEETLEVLHSYLATDFKRLFDDGVNVP